MKTSKNIFFDLKDLAGLGRNAIVGKTVRIRKPARVSIGNYSIIDDFTYISSGLVVGRYTHIGANSVLIGGDAVIHIGDFVNIAPGCRLIAASHDFTGGDLVGPAIPSGFAGKSIIADIHVGDHVLLGTNTVVLPGTIIPEGVATGAMTLLSPETRLKPWTLYVGIPARGLRPRDATRILPAAKRVLKKEPPR